MPCACDVSNQRFYHALHTDEETLKTSSSGGAFTGLVSAFFSLNESASVYGCILDENCVARHVRATDVSGTVPMRGSKYVESYLGETYEAVARDLAEGRAVLFSGTPCQGYALRSCLETKGVSEDKLFISEVVCHGAGSPKFFKDYLAWQGERHRGTVCWASFRYKGEPGQFQAMRVDMADGRSFTSPSTGLDWFYSVYNSNNYILRDSCYQCPFAKRERYADVSMADAWGANKDTDYGLSLIIVNTPKGARLLKAATALSVEETDWEHVHQRTLVAPTPLPSARKPFWDTYKRDGFLAAQKLVGNNTFVGKAKLTAAGVLRRTGLLALARRVKRVVSS